MRRNVRQSPACNDVNTETEESTLLGAVTKQQLVNCKERKLAKRL
jgi:hypothetical protein